MKEEYLLAALRMGAGADPVPEGVSAAARAVFGLRVPGGVPAGPVDLPVSPGARSAADSGTAQAERAQPETAHAGTAQDETTRPGTAQAGTAQAGTAQTGTAQAGVRRFSADGLVIDVETTVTEGRMEVAGQVSPAPGPDATIEVRTPHIAKVRTPSGSGHFAVAGLPPGWVSVVCHRPGHPPVFTRWIHVHP
ncbi:hypothetical protein [Microbispora hainanensis]|uniref:Uncharacterized protein n=1 Tax=Microbispora hainanensis TaxID=568844 RepID=A0A544YYP2_9ACTN|nr:hypothetical protein [Microbispora hainanensis]TQS21886.1 hypothetical protein FLX08_09860 [Microbispora hainanensis]